jgi:hypothetical protein
MWRCDDLQYIIIDGPCSKFRILSVIIMYAIHLTTLHPTVLPIPPNGFLSFKDGQSRRLGCT